MTELVALLAAILAFLPVVGVILLVSSRRREATGNWFAEKRERVWLLPIGFVSFYCLMATLRQEWQSQTFLETAAYFFLPTTLIYFTRREAGKIGWSDLLLILLFWMPTELGLLPMHWGKILGISYPAGIWCAVIFMFIIASGPWRKLDLNCEWQFCREHFKFLILTFLVIAYAIIPPALDIGFIKLGLNRDVEENWVYSSLILAGVFFVIAITEELLFRGLIQNILLLRMKFVPALVATSMIFGLSHVNNAVNAFHFPNWPYVLFATVAGLGYGYVYQRTRSLIAAALLHTAVDFVWVLFLKG